MDLLRPSGYYTIEIDGHKIDVGFYRGKKILNKVKKILDKDRSDEADFIKKDFRFQN
jgi:hypothetical protein